MKYKLKLQPKFVVIISIIIGIVMISSAFFELNESRKEIYRVLNEQASSLIKTISLSSINTLNSSYEIEDLISERLLDNARTIRYLDSLHLLNQTALINFGRRNNLYRINIFDRKGNRVLSNRIPEEGHIPPEGIVNRYNELKPVLTGQTKDLIIGLHEAMYSDGQRFAVAIARSGGRGAVVINLDAKDLLAFRKKIGIGKIIQDIGNKSGIEYIILQDSLGILAASSGVRDINAIEEDNFLMHAMQTDSVFMRKFEFGNHEVYEAVKRLNLNNDIIGLYRIGISLDEIKSVEARMNSRIILTTLILAAIAVIVLSIIFTSQNLKSVSSEYGKFKTFTGTVLQNMAEAVVVTDNDFYITLFNDSAEKLFGVPGVKAIGSNFKEFMEGKLSFLVSKITSSGRHTIDLSINTEINNKEKYLYINIAKNISEHGGEETYTFVMNDHTERKKLEEQAGRNEKLAAMGELASGVAHEIRNPINSIGMIAQRLNKEFTPEKDREEYSNITSLLKNEVSRINKIITQFLNYAKPLDVKLIPTKAGEFFGELFTIFNMQAEEKNIEFQKEEKVDSDINIDPELMKQALINIIQNAFDAVKKNGKVNIKAYNGVNNLIIEISDTGCGIPQDQIKKIFDLYYTTKKDGNGLGLSIANKIIDQHRGKIEIESKLNEGTKFTIKVPRT